MECIAHRAAVVGIVEPHRAVAVVRVRIDLGTGIGIDIDSRYGSDVDLDCSVKFCFDHVSDFGFGGIFGVHPL